MFYFLDLTMPSTSRDGGQGASPKTTTTKKKKSKEGAQASPPPSKRMRVGLASASSPASPKEEELGSEAIQAKLREAEADVEEVREETRAVRWGYLVRRALLADREAKMRANRAKLRGDLAAALKRERHRTAPLQCGLPTPIWVKIFEDLDPDSRLAFSMTCRQFRVANEIAAEKTSPAEDRARRASLGLSGAWDPRSYEGRSPPVFTISWYRWAWVSVCQEDKDYMSHLMALVSAGAADSV